MKKFYLLTQNPPKTAANGSQLTGFRYDTLDQAKHQAWVWASTTSFRCKTVILEAIEYHYPAESPIIIEKL